MRLPKLVIYGVSEMIHDELHNIADNHGLTFTDFMKPHLRTIVGLYPEQFKKPYVKVVVDINIKIEEKAKLIAELCQPCTKEVYRKVYRNAITVLNAEKK